MKHVTIYTDGACSGNPGPGGWAAILEYNGSRRELSGGEAQTTNNRMELTGVITALGGPEGALLRRPLLRLKIRCGRALQGLGGLLAQKGLDKGG